ncbi:c-type cytochrome [Rhizorhabdus argentea]|uniref:c-type cytochrome n=1 Tax=Rhizorhabdus argentea TaxID=1387174 RepID=UPI0030ED7C95
MSLRCPVELIALPLLLLAAGCDREARDSRGSPLPETAGTPIETTALYAGATTPSAADPRAKEYESNAFHLSEGSRLFRWMNCSGCHAHGGGGMGPPLMDDQWRYGGRMEQIVATIMQGRPNGMPSFRGKLTETQVWELAAYVRSLSGQARKDAVSSRADEMSNTEPATLQEREPVRPSDPASVAGTSQ